MTWHTFLLGITAWTLAACAVGLVVGPVLKRNLDGYPVAEMER